MANELAYSFLEDIQMLTNKIRNKSEDIEQMKTIAIGTTPYIESAIIDNELHNLAKMHSTGNPKKMENAIINYVDKEEILEIKKLKKERSDKIRILERLKHVNYDVLFKKYIMGMDYEKIAEGYDKSYSWATTIHGRALKELDNMLLAMKESNK